MSHETAEAIELPIKLPPELADHEWIAERVFYTLPKRLLDWLIAKIGAESFDPERLRVEQALSNAVADDPHAVGFEAGQPIFHTLLALDQEPLPCPDAQKLRQLGWPHTVKQYESTAKELLARF